MLSDAAFSRLEDARINRQAEAEGRSPIPGCALCGEWAAPGSDLCHEHDREAAADLRAPAPTLRHTGLRGVA
jgi:hypothetical protein